MATGSPTTPSEDASVVGRTVATTGEEAEDNHSDKGTYTIELENNNPEEEEARRMIDKVDMINNVCQKYVMKKKKHLCFSLIFYKT